MLHGDVTFLTSEQLHYAMVVVTCLQWQYEVTYSQMATGEELPGGDQMFIVVEPHNSTDPCLQVRASSSTMGTSRECKGQGVDDLCWNMNQSSYSYVRKNTCTK